MATRIPRGSFLIQRAKRLSVIILLLSFVFLFSACSEEQGDVITGAHNLPVAQGLSATSGDSEVVLNWVSVTGARGYNIYKADNNSPAENTTIQLDGAGNSYIDQNVVNGRTYQYMLSVENQYGEGGKSHAVRATPEAAIPKPVKGITITVEDGKIILNWTPFSQGHYYYLYRGEAPGLDKADKLLISHVESPYIDDQISAGVTYYYTLTVLNQHGESEESEEVSARYIPVVPDAPTGLTAGALENAVSLSWSPVDQATGYYLYWQIGGPVDKATAERISLLDSTYLHLDLSAGQTYHYAVAAVNDGVESDLSPEVAVIPTSPSDPNAGDILPLARRLHLNEDHSCLLREGDVFCWGDLYRLGGGIMQSHGLSQGLIGTLQPRQISSGARFNCYLDLGGKIFCQGENRYGQLGPLGSDIYTYPLGSIVPVTGIEQAVQIDSTWRHSCAVLGTGQVTCWGYNKYYQTGSSLGVTIIRTPVLVEGIDNAVQVAVAEAKSCALLNSGQIKCWGIVEEYMMDQLNVGYRLAYQPVLVPNIDNAIQVSGGKGQMCAILVDRSVKCWGSIGFGEALAVWEPVLLHGIENTKQLTYGFDYNCALSENGEVSCWGVNRTGRLGTMNEPVVVQGLTDIIEISSGYDHSCALQRDDKVYCWGRNAKSQLGNHSLIDSPLPVETHFTDMQYPEPVEEGAWRNRDTTAPNLYLNMRGFFDGREKWAANFDYGIYLLDLNVTLTRLGSGGLYGGNNHISSKTVVEFSFVDATQNVAAVRIKYYHWDGMSIYNSFILYKVENFTYDRM